MTTPLVIPGERPAAVSAAFLVVPHAGGGAAAAKRFRAARLRRDPLCTSTGRTV